MIDVVDVATPFTFRVSVLADEEKPTEFTSVVVAAAPLTVDVMTFPTEESVLVVRDEIEVVEIFPLASVCKMPPPRLENTTAFSARKTPLKVLVAVQVFTVAKSKPKIPVDVA